MKQILIHPRAEADINEAITWYEAQRPGLGGQLLETLHNAVDAIRAFPEQWPVHRRNTRRALLRRFPFLLFYRVHDDAIIIVACLHPSRNPRLWPR